MWQENWLNISRTRSVVYRVINYGGTPLVRRILTNGVSDVIDLARHHSTSIPWSIHGLGLSIPSNQSNWTRERPLSPEPEKCEANVLWTKSNCKSFTRELYDNFLTGSPKSVVFTVRGIQFRSDGHPISLYGNLSRDRATHYLCGLMFC